MRRAMDETNRRRDRQLTHNAAHGITPRTVEKKVADIMEGAYAGAPTGSRQYAKIAEQEIAYAALTPQQMARRIKELEKQMYDHARNLEFEEAARVRDQIRELQGKGLIA
jgi:excinuclease ABC subunit B